MKEKFSNLMSLFLQKDPNVVEYMLRFPTSRSTRFFAALSYLGMLCLVPLIFHGDNRYVYFHARQGLILWIWGLLGIFSLHIPVIGAFFFSFSVFAISIISLVGLFSAALGKVWRFPVIGQLAESL